jgi:hypothetical protein
MQDLKWHRSFHNIFTTTVVLYCIYWPTIALANSAISGEDVLSLDRIDQTLTSDDNANLTQAAIASATWTPGEQLQTFGAAKSANPVAIAARESATYGADSAGPITESRAPGAQPFAPAKDLDQRITDARYPRITQAWNGADNLKDKESSEATMARHDLLFAAPETFKLKWKTSPDKGQTAELDDKSIEAATAMRARLLEKNPNMVMLAEIRYHDAKPELFPADSKFWQHGENGDRIANPDYKKYDMLDFTNPEFQKHVVDQAAAAVKSGAVDGVMLDWWNDGHDTSADKAAKYELLKKVRDAVGPDALIMVNTNQKTIPEIMPDQTKNGDPVTPLVNGYYMESYNQKLKQSPEDEQKSPEIVQKSPEIENSRLLPGTEQSTPGAEKPWTKADYEQLANTLDYAQTHTREPRINTVETWPEIGNPDQRNELTKMRATTTLVMTHSDGYSLFADHDNNGKTQDHQHDWYDFYNTNTGKPLGPGAAQADGSFRREFQNGTVISNATGDGPVTVTFPEPRIKASDLNDKTPPKPQNTFVVNAQDGDIFMKP